MDDNFWLRIASWTFPITNRHPPGDVSREPGNTQLFWKKNLILERNQRECWFPWVRRCCCCCCCDVFSFSWCALAWKLRDSQPQTCCGGWKTQHRICLGWDSPVVWKAFWILLNSPFDLILFPYFLCCNDCKGSFTWRYPDDCKPEILSLSNGIKRPTTSQQPYQ